MQGDREASSLTLKVTTDNPTRDFDRLPQEQRAWLSAAALPRRPIPVHRTFAAMQAETAASDWALRHLNLVQQRLPARNA